jgi:mRNA interferase MazF
MRTPTMPLQPNRRATEASDCNRKRIRSKIGKLPSQFDDWLICMISSQLRHHVEGFDEIIKPDDNDFGKSGLKVASVIRIGRLAVVSGETCWAR